MRCTHIILINIEISSGLGEYHGYIVHLYP